LPLRRKWPSTSKSAPFHAKNGVKYRNSTIASKQIQEKELENNIQK